MTIRRNATNDFRTESAPLADGWRPYMQFRVMGVVGVGWGWVWWGRVAGRGGDAPKSVNKLSIAGNRNGLRSKPWRRLHRPVRQVGFRSGAPENRTDTGRDPSRCRTVLRHGRLTKSQAWGGRGVSLEPEIEYRPEWEFSQEVEKYRHKLAREVQEPLDQLPTPLVST